MLQGKEYTDQYLDLEGDNMPTEVEICSQALNQLGADSITSFDDDTNDSNMCRDFYPNIRDAVLRAYPWNCARVRQALARLAGTPLAGGDRDWTYRYTLPTDPYCLWVPKQLNEDLEHVIEGRKLLTDEATAVIHYIQKLTDTGQFDSLLSEAIEARMAFKLAYPVTGTMSLARDMWELYKGVLQEARTIDGMEGNLGQYESDDLTSVR